MNRQTSKQDNTAKKQTGARRGPIRSMLAAALMCVLIAAVGCGGKKTSDNGAGTQSSGGGNNTPEVTAEPVLDHDCILENDDLKLVMDHLTSQITVTDKATGAQWSFDHDELHPNAALVLAGANSDRAAFRISPTQDEITVTYDFLRWNLEKDCGYIVPPYMTEDTYESYKSAFRDAGARSSKYLTDYYRKYDVNSGKLREVEKERLLEEYPFLNDGVYYLLSDVHRYIMEAMAADFADAGYSEEQYRQDLKWMQKEDTVAVQVHYSLDGRDLHVAITGDLSEVDRSSNKSGDEFEILPYFDQGTERIYDEQGAYYGCMRGDSSFLCYLTSDPANGSCRIHESDDGFLYCGYGHGLKVDISVCYRFVASGKEEDLRGAYE